MTPMVAVVGASGRVGSAIARHLSERYEVLPIVRRSPDEDVHDVAHHAVAEQPSVLINAAGVAHIEHPTADDLRRLDMGNVELPAALAEAALDLGISMIHISSVKAADPNSSSPYALSKRRGDERLESEFAERFADAGLALIVVRPLALLFPPLTAGRLKRLRFLRWWPGALTPPVALPALAPATFLRSVAELVDDALARRTVGLSRRQFERADRGSLRDVRSAFRKPHPKSIESE